MKKIILSVVTIAFCAVSASAQVMGLYKNNAILSTYLTDDADSIVFSRATDPATIKIFRQGNELAVYQSNDADKIIYATAKEELPNTENGYCMGTIADYVDLGLPSGTLWATHNIGAEKETDYGLYFAWGETTGYTSDTSDGHSFDEAYYSLCNGSGTTMKKYCTDSSYGTVDHKTELDAADDAATANWGSKWRMPSVAEQYELQTECTWTWDSTNKGYKVTGTNGNSIFLPAAGKRSFYGLSDAGSDGGYWSGSLLLLYNDYAYYLNFSFNSGGFNWRNICARFRGLPVRAVRVSE